MCLRNVLLFNYSMLIMIYFIYSERDNNNNRKILLCVRWGVEKRDFWMNQLGCDGN